MPIQMELGDQVTLKKNHPCGSNQWLVLRVGADCKNECGGCGAVLMLPRGKLEKRIKLVNGHKPEESNRQEPV